MSARPIATGVAALAALTVTSALLLAGAPAEARRLPRIDAAASPIPAAAADAGNAADTVPGALPGVTQDPRLGVPAFLWGDTARATLPSLGRGPSPKRGLDAAAAARAHLHDLRDAWRLTADEVAALPLRQQQRLPNGAAIVRFGHQVDGVEVFREQANVLVDREGELVAVGGLLAGAAAIAPKRAEVQPHEPEAAVAAALADYGFPATVAGALQRVEARDGYVRLTLPPDVVGDDGSALAGAARAKRVWFRRGAELVAAYYVETPVRDGAWPRSVDRHAYVIAAADGAVLFRHNQTADAAFAYRVYAESAAGHLPLPGPAGRNGFPHPTGVPDGYQAPFAPANRVALPNLPFSRNDPWLPPDATRTIGNNVEAFANRIEPDGFDPADPGECNPAAPLVGDLHACTSGPGAFDYAYDTGRAPGADRAQVMAAVTNLFYMVNYLHDWYYDAGFDEASGNAQTDNFGRGGFGDDSLIAEAQDYARTDNADMTTPADGERPRMRMYLWSSSAVLARINAPAALAGVKEAGIAAFGPTSFDLTGDLVLARDAATTEGPTTTDGCTAFTNAAAVAGRIAVIDRGDCLFVVKVRNAQDAAAAGVLIVNNVPGGIAMGGDDPTLTIPVVSVTLADGAAIKAELARGVPVNMRLARASGVPRDGALDNTLIAHEWGHYISNRLVGNASGLAAKQAEGMGEGFADFHALLLLVKDEDRQRSANAGFGGAYPVSAYAHGGPDLAPDVIGNAWYYGIRRYPYSRDMTKNPLTFRHIGDGVALPALPPPSPTAAGGSNSEVHRTGEVWGSMLWECYANLLDDRPRLSFAQAQERMKRYLVGGYKMMPWNPTFIEARDAILAVMKSQDTRDHDLCLHGFAKRGAGVGAVAPNRFDEANAGVVESFLSVPPTGGVKRGAVEYHHAEWDHYFVTDIPDEIAKLDNGTFAGWVRTGEGFDVYVDAPPGSAGVCRFFSTTFAPRSSHFYTPSASECGVVRQNADWQLEGVVFGVSAPGPDGACPADMRPVYRLYNDGQGAAPNHRYTTRLPTREQMLARGWIPEGYGPLGVIMCAPP